jgi:hypothetical protein
MGNTIVCIVESKLKYLADIGGYINTTETPYLRRGGPVPAPRGEADGDGERDFDGPHPCHLLWLDLPWL